MSLEERKEHLTRYQIWCRGGSPTPVYSLKIVAWCRLTIMPIFFKSMTRMTQIPSIFFKEKIIERSFRFYKRKG